MNKLSVIAAAVLLSTGTICTASPEVDAAVQKARETKKSLEGKCIEVQYSFDFLTFHPKEDVVTDEDGNLYITLDNAIINGSPSKSPVQYVDGYDLPCQVFDQVITVIGYGEKCWFQSSFNHGTTPHSGTGIKIVYNGTESLTRITDLSKENKGVSHNEAIEQGKARIPRHYSLTEYYQKCVTLIGDDRLEPKVEDGKLVSLSMGHGDKISEIILQDASQGTIRELTFPMSTNQRVETYENFTTVSGISTPTRWTIKEINEQGDLVYIKTYSNISHRITDAPSSPDTFAITKSEGAKPLSGAHELLLPDSK